MKSLKILLAEDESMVAMALVSWLSEEGFEIKSVSNGKEALAELESNPDKYDILITDLDMPVLSGADLIKKLRVFRFPIEIAVITGSLNSRLKEELMLYRVKNVFPKPVDYDDLLSFLKDHQSNLPTLKPEIANIPNPLLAGDRPARQKSVSKKIKN